MAKATKKEIKATESPVSYRDLSDDKKAELLSQEFNRFNDEMAKKFGMIVTARLSSDQSSIRAILAPAKLDPNAATTAPKN